MEKISLPENRHAYRLTYNVFRPAIRGWVAQDPPRTILCLPLKKSAVPPHTTSALVADGRAWGWHTCITRIQLHRFKSIMRLQHCASPFPNSAHLALTRQLIAILGYRNRVEVFKSHIAAFEQSEKLFRVRILLGGYRGIIVMRMVRWWRFLDAVVGEMSSGRE